MLVHTQQMGHEMQQFIMLLITSGDLTLKTPVCKRDVAGRRHNFALKLDSNMLLLLTFVVVDI